VIDVPVFEPLFLVFFSIFTIIFQPMTMAPIESDNTG